MSGHDGSHEGAREERDANSVRVAVRGVQAEARAQARSPRSCSRWAGAVRPLIDKEVVEGCGECVSIVVDRPQVVLGKDKCFTFDSVYGPGASQPVRG